MSLDPSLRARRLDELELGPAAWLLLRRLGVETVGELLARDPVLLPPRQAAEIQTGLADWGIAWGPPIAPPPYAPPEAYRRMRYRVSYRPVQTAAESTGAVVDRVGGLPSRWTDPPGWPVCRSCQGPMVFLLQLIGQRAGGRIDLAGRAGLQVFACPDEDCASWVPGSGASAALLRDGLLDEPAPPAAPAEAAFLIDLAPEAEDARLADNGVDDAGPFVDELEHAEAFEHGLCDKVEGGPVTSQPVMAVSCRCGLPMRFLAQFGAESVAQPFYDGICVLHLCLRGHDAAYQVVR